MFIRLTAMLTFVLLSLGSFAQEIHLPGLPGSGTSPDLFVQGYDFPSTVSNGGWLSFPVVINNNTEAYTGSSSVRVTLEIGGGRYDFPTATVPAFSPTNVSHTV